MREDQQQPAKPGTSGRGTPEGPGSLPSEGRGSQEDAKSETLSEAAEDIARQWDTAVQPRQRAADAQSGKSCLKLAQRHARHLQHGPDLLAGCCGMDRISSCSLPGNISMFPCRWPSEPPLPAHVMLSVALLPLRALSRCRLHPRLHPWQTLRHILLCAGRTPVSGGWQPAEGVHLRTAAPRDGAPVRPARQA